MSEEVRKTQPIRLFTLGNMLTIARLVLLPVIIAGIALGAGYVAVAGMAAALLTDLLDGRVSRRLGTASEFGRNLDSTIDFVLLHSLFIALFAAGRLVTYQFAIIYVAMLATLVLQMLSNSAAPEKGLVRPKFGKPTGALEYTYLLFLIVREILPVSSVVGIVNTVIFSALDASALIYILECMIKVRRLV